MNPRETEAIGYVEEHKLQPLMQQLIELTTYHQPGDPRAFMIEQLKHLISARESGTEPPTLLEANNFAAIFGLIDITGRGTVSKAEAQSALRKVGIEADLFESELITRDHFVKAAEAEYKKLNITFKN
ncbi:Oidioi.mRNA.OKI2018_I69.PAR.g9867.t1.cds [Oikopleura dioica]|uniref:Oidioi.mRNA.OKI2018_I69.PAR.g9867.t1.cds n=1 Tax=Oikopleura dioica TaxID=34765 RepID=A0ABN7RVD5_OIKDI|nr:Oidioi.mRNA.OKI2018_I69.PAR.g9867.t1.cds [Oikopleura dioica]